MIHEVSINLRMSEIAMISQRALAEKMASVLDGPWQQLWHRIEAQIERQESRNGVKPRKAG